ncbi:MAG: D-alanine--D-alanine ligase, partial [Anaerolineaceae bacterium]|nr:D-alanine--D-alanine ligase [Anaerolineaceae bacterium]
RQTTVAVVFGGRSVEHDVSIVTASQVMRGLDRERYEIVPVYVSREGSWYGGEPLLDLASFDGDVNAKDGVYPLLLSPDSRHHGLLLQPLAGRFRRSRLQRIDVVFPTIHGTHGEDGTLQGLLELADVPYVGCLTLGSALANDKISARAVMQQQGIPLVPALHFHRQQWRDDPESLLAGITERFEWPVFVKPATGGSSIGIGRADDESLLRASIDVATHFDRRILVEQGLTGHVEINCSVLGNSPTLRASVLEQPLSWEDFLTYEEKYLHGPEGMKGAGRIVPAPLDEGLTQRIQELAIRAFRAIDGHGIARIDFFVKPETEDIWLGEINTMPGSLAAWLWQESGLSFSELLDELVSLARAANVEKRRNSYDFRSDLISLARQRGQKGGVGKRSFPAD